MDPLKMYFLLKMGIFHGYVTLPEGNKNLVCITSHKIHEKRDFQTIRISHDSDKTAGSHISSSRGNTNLLGFAHFPS